ncbi:MAG: PorV/PorQ family protein [Calditrichaeota bacterium]|nr:PorV/PorQ family protein [Calditrichota bacterium]MCB9366445.1 PorV/PorQ family protein [Calditrichota bacterium]MCB9391297.1 PorV/PorQ family protein [Calditrichota bacterium]
MKNRMFALCVILAGLFASQAHAASVSQATLLFLKIAPGARPTGMGESFVAIADDATATWWNPAGLGFQTKNEVTMMYSRWLPQFNLSDLYYAFVGGTYHLPEWGTVGANVMFLNLGETQRTGPSGEDLGKFSSYEMAITGTYGALVNDNLSMGVALKLAYSNLSPVGAGAEQGKGVATAIAADLGLLYKATFMPGLSLGANLSNMGPKVSYIDRAQADPLPTTLKMGVAFKVLDQEYNKLTIASDVDKELVKRDDLGRSDEFYEALFSAWGDGDLVKSLIWHVGAEYWYSTLVGLRGGYYNDHLGRVFPYTFGVSLKYSTYRFDFSYLTAGENHPLTDTMRYSLSVEF